LNGEKRACIGKAMTMDISGVFPPVTTPFERSGRLDLKSFRENLRAYNRFRLHGYLVLGSSGEAASLEFEERIRLIETARKEIPSEKLLLVGTGAQSLQETLKLTRIAAANEADAALVLPPFYYRAAMTPEVLLRYYSELGRMAQLPIMIYSIPQFTGFQMTVTMIGDLSRKKNIVGLKESSGNVSYLAEIIESTAPQFQNVTGSALTFVASLLLGAVGGILALADVAPQECVDIFEDFKAGRLAQASRKQRVIMKLARTVTTRFGVAGLKAGVTVAGFQGGFPRAPLRPLTLQDRRAVRQIFQEMKSNW
jgi:4-hydroxy-2-oxoglutarate aldolase